MGIGARRPDDGEGRWTQVTEGRTSAVASPRPPGERCMGHVQRQRLDTAGRERADSRVLGMRTQITVTPASRCIATHLDRIGETGANASLGGGKEVTLDRPHSRRRGRHLATAVPATRACFDFHAGREGCARGRQGYVRDAPMMGRAQAPCPHGRFPGPADSRPIRSPRRLLRKR